MIAPEAGLSVAGKRAARGERSSSIRPAERAELELLERLDRMSPTSVYGSRRLQVALCGGSVGRRRGGG